MKIVTKLADFHVSKVISGHSFGSKENRHRADPAAVRFFRILEIRNWEIGILEIKSKGISLNLE